MKIPIDQIKPSPFATRPKDSDVASLAKSIKEHGQLQPIKVRFKDGGYECIFGHRRLAAALLAGEKQVEAIVQDLDDQQARLQIWEENEEREDLSDLARARFIEAYGEDYCKEGNKISLSALCKQFNLSETHIANLRCLLWEPPPIQEAVRERQVTEHQVRDVRHILKDDKPARVQVIQEAVRGDLGEDFTIKDVRARAKAIKYEKRTGKFKKRDEQWQELPTVKDLTVAINGFRESIYTGRAMVKQAKLAPEAKQFIANKLEHLIRLLEQWKEELRGEA